MFNYTKISDEMVAEYGLKTAWVYSKLRYRMNLSHKSRKFFKDGYFIIYKIKDLMHDCYLGRNVIINALNKLENNGLIKRVHTMYASKIYLPKFNNHKTTSQNKMADSLESKPRKERKDNNKNINNNVCRSSVSSVKKRAWPKINEINKRYGSDLVKYAMRVYHIQKDIIKINSPYHFVVGVLRRWHRKNIKTVAKAMRSEHDSHAPLDDNGPEIPIFRI